MRKPKTRAAWPEKRRTYMEPYWSEDELAKHLKVSRSFLWELRKKGLPCIRIGRTVRYQPDAVAEWLSRNQNNQQGQHEAPQGGRS